MSKPEFKKGQTVIHFSSEDYKGTVSFTRALVKSCGKVKMTLENAETGVMMGTNFRPDTSRFVETTYKGKTIQNWYNDLTMSDMTDDEAVAMCLELAAAELARNLVNLNLKLTSDAYNHDAVRESIAALHEPRAVKR